MTSMVSSLDVELKGVTMPALWQTHLKHSLNIYMNGVEGTGSRLRMFDKLSYVVCKMHKESNSVHRASLAITCKHALVFTLRLSLRKFHTWKHPWPLNYWEPEKEIPVCGPK